MVKSKIKQIFLSVFLVNIVLINISALDNDTLAPLTQAEQEVLSVFLTSDPSITYDDLEYAIHQFAGPKCSVKITSANGRSEAIEIPHPSAVPETQKIAIYKQYIAKLFARDMALSNPFSPLLIEMDIEGDQKTAEEKIIRDIILEYFNSDQEGMGTMRFLRKANNGNPVGVFITGDQFPVMSLSETVGNYKTPEELRSEGKNIVTLGVDIGGTGIKICIKNNGQTITSDIYKDDEAFGAFQHALIEAFRAKGIHLTEADIKIDRKDGVISCPSFGTKDMNPYTGETIKNVLVTFVSQMVDTVNAHYINVTPHAGIKVRGLFIDMPGIKNSEKNCMNSCGELASRVSEGDFQVHMDKFNEFIPELKGICEERAIQSFDFGNDMEGHALYMATQAGFNDAVGFFFGGGLGTFLLKGGKMSIGFNEGGHHCIAPNMIVNESANCVAGSHEQMGGSRLGIQDFCSDPIIGDGLAEDMRIEFGINLRGIDNIDIGRLAAGLNPFSGKELTTVQKRKLQPKALNVYRVSEKYTADHMFRAFKMIGDTGVKDVTNFILGGGPFKGETGKIRLGFVKEHLLTFLDKRGMNPELKIQTDKQVVIAFTIMEGGKSITKTFDIRIVDENAAAGSAERALRDYQDMEASKAAEAQVGTAA
ncbi:MAG: hypothetical protein JW774_00150 [Candidatus Aureabacteria bacterium]|nr:hypothetical protein [Candidatus Auribacterota bacterium]